LVCFEPKGLSAVWVAVQKGMPRNDPGRLPKTHKADQKWSALGVFRPKSQAVVWFGVQKGMPRNDPGRLPKTHKADQKWSAFGLFLLCKIITK